MNQRFAEASTNLGTLLRCVAPDDPNPSRRPQFVTRIIKDANQLLASQSSLMVAVAERRRAAIAARGGRTVTVASVGRVALDQGVRTPLDLSISVDAVTGHPELRGTTVKGVTRSFAALTSEEFPSDLFGTVDGIGDVRFLGGWLLAPPTLVVDVVTPHHGDYYDAKGAPGQDGQPPIGPWDAPVPVQFLAIEDARVEVGFEPVDGKGDRTLDAGRLAESALDLLGLGAKTTSGYGYFAVEQVEK